MRVLFRIGSFKDGEKLFEFEYRSLVYLLNNLVLSALQVSTLTLQQEDLKRQLQNTESKAKRTGQCVELKDCSGIL